MKPIRSVRTSLAIIKGSKHFRNTKNVIGEPFDFPGVQVFGWWMHSPPPDPVFLIEASRFWKEADVELLAERDGAEEEDGSLHQNALYIKIDRFPPDDRSWKAALECTLALFVQNGAAISWAGDYTCMWHYQPTESMTACYAAYTAQTGLLCLSGLDEELRFLEERADLVRQLHQAVRDARGGTKGGPRGDQEDSLT